MPITERTPQKLVAKSGSTTLTLSKQAGQATMQRKFLFWKLRPAEKPLVDITEVKIEAAVDRASGVEFYSTMLVMRTGTGWIFPCSDKNDALTTADAFRDFLGLGS